MHTNLFHIIHNYATTNCVNLYNDSERMTRLICVIQQYNKYLQFITTFINIYLKQFSDEYKKNL